MQLSPLNTALVQICEERNEARRRYEELQREGAHQLLVEAQAGRAAGLSRALDILRTVGEQPVSAANYIAGSNDHDQALENIAALVGRPE